MMKNSYFLRIQTHKIQTFFAFFLVLMMSLLVGQTTVKAQSCNCSDYLYLNDPSNKSDGFVHKFKINADGSLLEMANGTSGTKPWFPIGGGLPDPHGLGQDLNGNIYIGETPSGKIRRLSCDGTLEPTTKYMINDGGFNFNSYNGVVYVNSKDNNKIKAYDLCTGASLGFITLTGVSGDDWGFSISTDGTFYVTSSGFGNNAEGIYRFKPTLANFTANTAYTQLVGVSAYPSDIGTIFATWGITSDTSGNMYVVVENQSTSSVYETRILKFNSSGTLTAQLIEPWTFDNKGIEKGRGIIFHQATNSLYIAGGPNADCIARVNPTNMTYTGTAAPYMPGQNPKGLALGRECCPTAATATVDTTLCNAAVGSRLFLQKLIGGNCDGPLCGGTWTVAAGNTGFTFNDCDNSITVNSANACGTFTISGGGGNSQCAVFSMQVKVKIADIKAPVVAGDQTICQGADPVAFTVSSPAQGGGTILYQWQQSTTSCTTGFTNIIGAMSSIYDAGVLNQTTYYRLIASTSGTCSFGGTCSDISQCITITVNPKAQGSNAPVVTQATCNTAGTAANNDAQINITGITNGTNYSVDGGATVTFTGGTISLTGLSNPASSKIYKIKIWGTDPTCFVELSATLDPKVCTPACTPPTSVTATITPSTCAGAAAQSNGILQLSGFTTEKYQYVMGTTFTGTATPNSPTGIPSNGVLISNLSNTAQSFTVRIYNISDNTCYIDRTLSLMPVVCNCPPPACVPIGISVNN